ncbi:glutamate 5-kinase [Roseicyclus sp. F158]|uniref:Glutamate 5-kinase n=1 Tax=Tropicimonas omnivorans TaxID=3075590 RepID=A0ABU3DJG3_9RHOB|nr:glutamate 5-kinase [Roseicyclus sp. F158]MDT0683854.1 glutamate 5-kinase [Roseicyclus sp. F158]
MAPLTLASGRRIVVKIGSALLVDAATGALREDWLTGLAEDVAALRRNADVILVSSGSIALGRRILGLAPGDLSLDHAQAAASVGQIRLARAYEAALGAHGIISGQVLLTLDDSASRRRYLNIRATLQTLLGLGAVPVVNENDTIATDEIRYGDNDRLAAQVAVTIGADRLILLSDVDGLYTANPALDPGARHLPEIGRITPEIEAMAGDPVSGLSKGGMRTKLAAAKTATAGGCAMAIARGDAHRPLAALDGGARSTWFLPQDDPQVARKRWIGAMKAKGTVAVDAGAGDALRQGRSLLPAGVTAVTGRFERGDPVEIVDPGGARLGLGLVRYAAAEASRIIGARSEEIEDILGHPARSALIHRDDMVL